MRSWPIYLGTLIALRTIPTNAVAAEKGWRGNVGIGVIGDSYSDEYQFYAPHRSTARCWVEILAETRSIPFGPFRADPADPHRRGYAYNWARSGATTADMIADGQHTGVAGQVARGEVGLVWVFIGGNDFINSLDAPRPLEALAQAAPRAAANVQKAVDTVLQADPGVRVVVATVPDVCDLPEFAEPIARGRLDRNVADAARAAIQRFNAALWNLKNRDPRITIVDLYWPLKLATRFAPGAARLFGVKLDLRATGDDLGFGFLEDKRHAGLVLQALLARLFVDTLNARFGAGIPRLEDQEVLDYARRLGLTIPAPATAASRSEPADPLALTRFDLPAGSPPVAADRH